MKNMELILFLQKLKWQEEGRTLRKRRKRAGVTMAVMAWKMDVERKIVRFIEHGKHLPERKSWLRLYKKILKQESVIMAERRQVAEQAHLRYLESLAPRRRSVI